LGWIFAAEAGVACHQCSQRQQGKELIALLNNELP
jgi:hypothetical protein